MLDFIKVVICCALGYVIGSVPWALVIGKTFYHKDIREYGSHNLGGTNAGRVLGKPIGLLVIFLDAMKAFIVMWICSAFCPLAIPYAGVAVSVGHCFPLFAQFKGGKGVACAFGYLLGLGVFGGQDIVFTFVYPLLVFLLVLGLSRMVSLSSMCGLLFAAVLACFVLENKGIIVCIALLAILVIFRHIPNILRIVKGKESKVSFIK